ncbi:hypothetical protein GUV66_10840, partial [Stenotrophomonas maltophilia]|nr:hypothetical protein [Stenotrophomonas maltophilia]MCF3558115.1 hypothetical protein [Stenotrophomonas maltophilia]
MFIRDIFGKWWLPHLSRPQRARMNHHKNARLTVHSRALLIRR